MQQRKVQWVVIIHVIVVVPLIVLDDARQLAMSAAKITAAIIVVQLASTPVLVNVLTITSIK